MTPIGRNDSCPCGSGRKYKRCHLPEDEARGGDGAASAQARMLGHPDVGRLLVRVFRYANSRFGAGWTDEAVRRFRRRERGSRDLLQLLLPYAGYHAKVEGRPAFEWFLAERAAEIEEPERRWLEAQREAWLSVWEATEVRPRVGIGLRDLLTGESRYVRELSASRQIRARQAILGRVVPFLGGFELDGVHPRPLPPTEAAGVVEAIRRSSRLPDGDLSPARLRDGRIEASLIEAWEEAVDDLDSRPLPTVANTDGDPLVLTTDRFEFDPEHRAEVVSGIAGLAGVQGDEPEKRGIRRFTFLRTKGKIPKGWQNLIVGSAFLGPRSLRLETNSIVRADALRRRVEGACGERLRYLRRSRSKPRFPRAAGKTATVQPPHSPEAAAIVRATKERHYETWIDEPLPALDGATPRQAVRDAEGRRKVDVLLKEFEFHEHGVPEAERFDVRRLRERLALGD